MRSGGIAARSGSAGLPVRRDDPPPPRPRWRVVIPGSPPVPFATEEAARLRAALEIERNPRGPRPLVERVDAVRPEPRPSNPYAGRPTDEQWAAAELAGRRLDRKRDRDRAAKAARRARRVSG